MLNGQLLNMENRFKKGENVSLFGIVGNLFLAILKSVFGIISGSTALLADALDSFSDILLSLFVLLGMKAAKKPPDEEHHYGHFDIEPVVGFMASLVLIFMGLEMARHSYFQMGHSSTIPTPVALLAVVISMIIKGVMVIYTLRVAREINSAALKSMAQNYKGDIFTSVVVFVGIAGAISGYRILDPLTGIIVSIIVIKMGIGVGYENIRQLMGTLPNPKLVKDIQKSAMRAEGTIGVHNIKVHTMGAYMTVDLHACVDENMALKDAHRIAHKVQKNISEDIPEVYWVLVHIEPYDDHHREQHCLHK